jgi:biotin synthase-like enzyme
MQKRLKKDLKEKYENRLFELNEKLDPQFRLSKIDIEDIVNSKTIIADKDCIIQPKDADVSFYS